jgi:hypothetical protein
MLIPLQNILSLFTLMYDKITNQAAAFHSFFFTTLLVIRGTVANNPLITARDMQYTATRKQTANSASTAMTSSRKYWYQARSSTAERK